MSPELTNAGKEPVRLILIGLFCIILFFVMRWKGWFKSQKTRSLEAIDRMKRLDGKQ